MKHQKKKLMNFKLRSKFNIQDLLPSIPDRLIGPIEDRLKLTVPLVATLNIYLVNFENEKLVFNKFRRYISVNNLVSMVNGNQDAMNVIDVYANRVGELICCMHADDMVYGDLNIKYVQLIEKDADDVKPQPNWMDHSNIHVILTDLRHSCYKSSSPHAKAIDLYMLEQTMNDTEKLYPGLFYKILEAYKDYGEDNVTEIISKYEEIKLTGLACPRGL